MDNKLLLAKSITLLYRESLLNDGTDNSADLVRIVLDNIQVSDIGIGVNTEREIIIALKNTVLELCNHPHNYIYNKTDLLQQVKINTGDDEKLYEAIKSGVEDQYDPNSLKRSILNLRKSINTHFKEQKISEILNAASQAFKYKRDKIKDVNQFITELMAQLEPLQINNTVKDPAIIDDLDISDGDNMNRIFTNVQKTNDGKRIYKTGWKALNAMLQGGFRPGEAWMFAGLQHKYKTGFSLSVFKQIALYNKPFTEDANKKPLLLRISFEDDLVSNLQFLYQSLKYDETSSHVDIKKVTVEEMSLYVKTRLQINGFHIKLIRVDPTQWSYRSICNKIIELESQGYNIEVLMLDYLAQVPTIGCTNTGAMGTDLRDLIRRVRNFAAPKGITVITPHQLSSEAKGLIRSGMPEDKFVKEIAEKGYYAGSKQIDQEFDGILLIHLFKHNKETYFTVQRDKHRLPTIISEDDKYFMLKFPKNGMPLKDDAEDEDQSFKKLPTAASNASDDLFKLG